MKSALELMEDHAKALTEQRDKLAEALRKITEDPAYRHTYINRVAQDALHSCGLTGGKDA